MLMIACQSEETGGGNTGQEVKEEVVTTDQVNETEEAEDAYYPVTYTTYNYAKEPVEVTIEKEPESVVAVYQNSIETLLALGLEDKIVAAAGLDHKVKPELEDAFSKVKYLDAWQPTKETVVMENPDFILSWYSYFSDKRIGDVAYYHDRKIGTYMALNSGPVSPRTLQNECDDILNLGKIFNVQDKAEAIVDQIKTRVEEVAEKAKEEEQKSALIIEFSKDTIWSYGETSLGGDMVIKLGAELLSPEGNDLGAEDVLSYNPDAIFVVYYNGGDKTDIEAETQAMANVLDNPKFANLDAVKNNKVFAIPLGEMYASGIRTIDGIERFAKGIYE
ncbi:iron ABC transporter substrate-binding protein [Acidaminobacter sp. JC074]|nr:iron ABC transporter substrate-binding protein [Acidaminobacter sp. JC074]